MCVSCSWINYLDLYLNEKRMDALILGGCLMETDSQLCMTVSNLCQFFLHSAKVTKTRILSRQECIPVGCVPPAAVVVRGGSGPDPPEFPPWVWAWIWSPLIFPLGVGLDLIPLNFPLGCGPGPDPPQFPPGCGPGEGGLLATGGLLGRGSPWQGGLPVRGVSLGGLPACTEADPPVDRQTPVRT